MKSFRPNDDFVYYLYWIAERMEIFWNRVEGKKPPYTNDRILQDHKFTNVYRALDRSSQYLIKEVIGKDHTERYTKEEMFWRVFIYKHFNLPDTWELIKEGGFDINLGCALDELGEYLAEKANKGATLYSNAYMMTTAFLSGKTGKYTYLKEKKLRKHQYYFHIFKDELKNGGKLQPILESKTLEEMFNNLVSVTSFGEFTAYQIVQDLNYTSFFDFGENEFCAAGPGTIRGIHRTFDIEGTPDYQEIIKWVQKNFRKLMNEYGIPFKGLIDWDPKIADLSNCFCETDKYLRGLGGGSSSVAGKRIKQVFKESDRKIEFAFPQKWGIKL